MSPRIRGVATRARIAPLRFALVAAGAALLVAATAYLGTASVLWYLRVGDLNRANIDLAGALSTQKSTTSTAADQIVALGARLDTEQSDLISQAHRKALMQDDQIAYREMAGVLKQCADERTKVVTAIQSHLYYASSVHAYDDGLTNNCQPVVSALQTQIAGESK